MRHGGQVGNHWVARDVLPQNNGKLPALLIKALAGDQFMQDDAFPLLIGQFNANHGAAGDGRYAR